MHLSLKKALIFINFTIRVYLWRANSTNIRLSIQKFSTLRPEYSNQSPLLTLITTRDAAVIKASVQNFNHAEMQFSVKTKLPRPFWRLSYYWEYQVRSRQSFGWTTEASCIYIDYRAYCWSFIVLRDESFHLDGEPKCLLLIDQADGAVDTCLKAGQKIGQKIHRFY